MEHELKKGDEIKEKPRKKGRGLLIIVILLLVIWFGVRPGVFVIQPIGALPEGITIIYYSRNPEMPFFLSPDGLCLEIYGLVSLLCRAAGIGAVDELADRILLRLPYLRWAYLLSTGGLEFDQ